MPCKRTVIYLFQAEMQELFRFIDKGEDQDYMLRIVEGWLTKAYSIGLEDGRVNYDFTGSTKP